MENLSQENNASNEVSVKDWMITILITAIPLVGLIMLFVWAFGSGAQPSKVNWAKASLIWLAIFIALYIVGIFMFGAAFLAAASAS